MGVSKIVKNVKFYLLKFYSTRKKVRFLRFFSPFDVDYGCKKAVYES